MADPPARDPPITPWLPPPYRWLHGSLPRAAHIKENALNLITRCIAVAMTAAPLAAFAAEDPGLRGGDPARWSEPIATPAQRLENTLKEARNALADALKECQASAGRKSCEAEARAQYRNDVAAAKQQAADSRPR
jgi:hypothetical protein